VVSIQLPPTMKNCSPADTKVPVGGRESAQTHLVLLGASVLRVILDDDGGVIGVAEDRAVVGLVTGCPSG
jgi:hypothetical protein